MKGHTKPDWDVGINRFPPTIYNPISTNINNIGSNTKIQDTIEAPDLQIKFSTHVQNTTYNSFKQKINIVFETAHV